MTQRLNSRRLLRVVIRYCAIYAAFCLLILFFQRSMLFFPTHNLPATRLIPWISDGQTIGYSHEVPSPNAVWLMMHGNAGQASDRDYVLEHMSAQDALYVLEYPGYGARVGAPSRNSIDAAALHAFSILRARHPGIPVCVVGESVGSGPASVLANAPQPPEKIVLVTPFDTLYRVAARRFFFLPVWLLLLDRWDNVYALKDYRGEIEIYGAEGDTVIPVHHARQLSEACANGTFHLIPGGHNDWSSCAAVRIER